MKSYWPLILTSTENFVLISTALSLLFFGTAAFIRASRRSRSWHPHTLARLYSSALTIPPLAALWLVCASLLPVIWLGPDQWVREHHAPHTTHLFSAFTVSIEPILGYAAISFVTVALGAAAYTVARGYFRIGDVVRRLELDSEPAAPERIRQVEAACSHYGINVGLVVSRYAFSFVWGYFRSKLVLSTGLINALSSDELGALLEHEAAHHARRDNLSKWMLTICRYLSPAFLLTRVLYRWWSEQVEMVCDEVAARRTGKPIEVAGAMLRSRRLTLEGPRAPQTVESGFFSERGAVLECRLERVLSLDDSLQDEPGGLSRSWLKASAVCGVLFVLTLGALFTVSPLAVHRLLELVFRVF
jgi:Zn-dependent protease with chaperone function